MKFPCMKIPCMKMKFPCMKMGQVFSWVRIPCRAPEFVYSPTTHEHVWGENHSRGKIFIFMHGNIMFMHKNVIFMLETFMPPFLHA